MANPELRLVERGIAGTAMMVTTVSRYFTHTSGLAGSPHLVEWGTGNSQPSAFQETLAFLGFVSLGVVFSRCRTATPDFDD